MSADKQWLVRALAELDKRVQSVATPSIPGIERILNTPGKRRRPTLLFQIINASRKPIDDIVLHAACAIELVHIASLIHDDISDKEQLRRGVHTISAVEGTDIALLAGDYLLAKACSFATAVDAESGGLIAETIAHMCIGQSEEISSRYDTSRTKQHLIKVIEAKTASLFVAAAKLGGRLAGLGIIDQQAATMFAQQYGVMYQLQNDIQDFYKQRNTASLITTRDYEVGNYTLPLLIAFKDESKDTVLQLLSNSSSHQKLISFLEENHYLKQAKSEANRYQQKALKAAQAASSKQLIAALLGFLKFG